jgi:probable HAF family extracellular repeat protein
MIQRLKTLVLAATMMGTFVGVSSAQATFRGFGVRDAYINDMSADGSVVVGLFVDAARNSTAFRWTPGGGIEEIGGIMTQISVSRDGKTIVGAALDSKGIQSAAIWQGGKNWRTLGGVPDGVPGPGSGAESSLSTAGGVSADGSVIVGSANVANLRYHAFRWDAVNGMVDLGTLLPGQTSSALGVSANGTAIVGFQFDPATASHTSNSQAAVVFSDGIERLIHPYGWAGTALASNNDGSTIIGQGHPANSSTSPGGLTTWRFSAWDGSLVDLGAVWQASAADPAAEYRSRAMALDDTGTVIVGASGASQRKAYIWTPVTGMVTVMDYLTAIGVTSHNGWDLRSAAYASPSGKVIAGVGFNPQMIAESWIVTLP